MKGFEEKTVEELRKMASKKKIEGRSKMNKAQLIRALSKSKKKVGGALSESDIDLLVNHNYQTQPLRIQTHPTGVTHNIVSITRGTGRNLGLLVIRYGPPNVRWEFATTPDRLELVRNNTDLVLLRVLH